MEPRTWTKDEIKNLLITNDKAVARGIVAIYNRQTDDEKFSKDTHNENGVGFNKFDAEILTSIAEWYINKGWLSEKQIAVARKRVMKYSGQLVAIANGGI